MKRNGPEIELHFKITNENKKNPKSKLKNKREKELKFSICASNKNNNPIVNKILNIKYSNIVYISILKVDSK